ncbi:MAG TPA: tetratricopeptide repeat-containing glycosyltransferase family protein [Rhodopila sp.]|uniref:tetratricopeptide repeat-containing glycosyltransferase family protein n=1 Tax=Rhodopila sp. TaxID=2480087 RepID=UPI002B72983B|nr:tetratricopeptide repeat-containing glycosyltransferase family protein [Rhodopila sp.]HVY14914.1 tetratricopeptide repeat-containing glycosyltransferase family protein [Rhodopila sp.]
MTYPDTAIAEHAKAFDLHCQGRMQEAEAAYRAALSIEPDLAEGWMNLGLVAISRKRSEEALGYQREALRLDPDNADALNNAGIAHYTLGNVAEAEACFRGALRLKPAHGNAMLNLGSTRQLANDVDDAIACYLQAESLGVDPARVKTNLALAMMEQGRAEDAEAHCRAALAIAPTNAEAHANRAMALLLLGRLEEGWSEYESRWVVETMGHPLPPLPKPRWIGQDVAGKTVLLYAEQGFGDVLQFSRYAPMVAARGARVVLVVPKPLQRLMRTLHGVAEVLSDEDEGLPEFDYHCPLMSLPFAFKTTVETIPGPQSYLHADPAGWAPFLETLPGLKVGLVWAGKSRTDQPHAVAIDKRRSMRLADMASLLSVPGCSFVSLQLGPPARQMAGHDALVDVSDRLTDWNDTAELIAGLDLVIAVDTAVAHLAGALGRPVWMLNRYDTCWRWFQQREDTPWYPTMRLFRQTRKGDWSDVVARVRAALAAAAGGWRA